MTDEKLLRAFQANERAINRALTSSFRTTNAALARLQFDQARDATLISAFLVGARLETKLRILLHTPRAFSGTERETIRNESQIIGEWRTAIDLAFASRYDLRVTHLPSNLDFTPRTRYCALRDHVLPLFESVILLRNKIAHGQFIKALDRELESISEPGMKALSLLTPWKIKMTNNLLTHTYNLIFDLAVTKVAFERDFDHSWAAFEKASQLFADSSAASRWEQKLRTSYTKAKPDRQGRN